MSSVPQLSSTGAPKAPVVLKRARLRAVQRLEYNCRLVEPGEVFDFVGPTLPRPHVAVRCDAEVGPAPPTPPLKEAPPWTTAGFVKKASFDAGSEVAPESLPEFPAPAAEAQSILE